MEELEFLLDEGLSDRAGGLAFIYSTYVIMPLLFIAVVLLALYSLLRVPLFAFLLALVLALLAVILSLLIITQILKARKGIAIIGLLLLFLAWALTVLGLLRSPLREVVFVSSILLSIATFFAGLFIVGGFLLPFPPLDAAAPRDQRWRQRFSNHWTAFRILLDYSRGSHYPFWVVTDEPREEDKIEERGKGNALAMLAFGRGIIISDCDHAVAVSSGMRFSGVQGPGLLFTGFAERPMRTLDLRPQLRAFNVEALTLDGIQVKVLAFTPFQIDRGEQQPKLGQPFPYRRNAAFRAVHAQMMELPENRDHPQHTWDDLPKLIGTRILQDILSRYRFDEFYEYKQGEMMPRVRIANEFREQLKAQLEPLGIQLLGGGISNLLPVKDKVLEERIRNWRAEWTRRILLKQAEGQRERIWRIEQARAQAQAELILALGERLAELDKRGAPVSPDTIVGQFIRVLEDMAQQPMLRRYLPRDTSEDLRRLSGEGRE